MDARAITAEHERERARPHQHAQHATQHGGHMASGMGYRRGRQHTGKPHSAHPRASQSSTRDATPTRPARTAHGQRDGIRIEATSQDGCQRHHSRTRAKARAATSTRPAREAHGQRDGISQEASAHGEAAFSTSKREPEHARGHINTPSTLGTEPSGWDMIGG